LKNTILDVETTTFAKGSPYAAVNSLVSVHVIHNGTTCSFKGDDLSELQDILKETGRLILFNGKFDLAWLRRVGLHYTKTVYDVQLAHFYLTNQLEAFPSLAQVAEYYGYPGKLDVVKTEYWDKGIDTPDIPWEVLKEYGERDVEITKACWERQLEDWKQFPVKEKLFKLGCQDLLVLQEMEWNGLHYEEELCEQKSQELQKQIQELQAQLNAVYPGIPINFNSNDQLSAFLYGGTIFEEGKELIGFYKTGEKAGQPKYKNIKKEHMLPRLFSPLPKTEMAKPGIFSTAEGTLRKLKGKRQDLIELLLALAKLTKLNETYYEGLTALNKKMGWEKNYLHGQFNQCIAKTGRLSSSQPNLQNLSGDSLDIFTSRYEQRRVD
jgi:DNA polymerase I-like protein with 3'-5' exonuclease and polymerase domains